jgi:hypothetical protein
VKRLAMDSQTVVLIIIFMYFLGCITGFGLHESLSQYELHNLSKARAAHQAQLTGVAEEEHRHDGKKRSIRLLAVVISLVIVFGVIVFDHFKGPLFPDVFYCLNDDGAQITRMCTGRVPPD